MDIHIVNRADEGGILYRLAFMLVDETGWTIGPEPRSNADLNYFFYITYAEHYSNWHETPIAAWFTHYETGTHYKEYWWELAAREVDLRLTSAQMYLNKLEQIGPTVLVTPGLDREFFNLPEKPKRRAKRKLAVGLSGYVCSGGRKGEHLVEQLVHSSLASKLDLVGSGRGWPTETAERDFHELPAFYHGIDVLLCPSIIEGIPMPPLEALSCGTPVIIPQNVGLLDELPDIRGIYRYGRDDFDGMCNALRTLLRDKEKHDQEALRAVTEKYTPQQWAADHEVAFQQHLGMSGGAANTGICGAFWVAYGKPARKCARTSISTFRQQHHAEIKTALVSTETLDIEDIFVKYPDEDIGGRSAKTQIYDLAPLDWQYVAYFDADTEFIANVSFLFQALRDGWDFVICKNPAKYHVLTQMVRPDNHDECEFTFDELGTSELTQLNGGVFAFRRNHRTAKFFRAWHQEWQRYGKRDQGALIRALFDNPLKLYVLGNEWNCITRYMPSSRSAGILHYPLTARRWRGKVFGRSDSEEAWAAVRRWKGGHEQKGQ